MADWNRASTMALVLGVALAIGLRTGPAAAQLPASEAAPRMPTGFALAADTLLAKSYPPNAPGAVAIVVKDGRPVFRRAYGLADLEFGVLLEPDMVFRVGSLTKQFTAAAILQLVDQGKLALDDPVTKYVDGYDAGGHRVTIDQLLTHTSGVPNYTDMDEWFPHLREELTPWQILDIVKTKPFSFDSGTRFKYSNTGYLLLGLVIEKVSGRSYADYIRQMVLPLGMRQTMYDDPLRVMPRRVRGYEHYGDEWHNARYIGMSQPFAAGAIVSSADDLALWDTAILRGRILSESSRTRWFMPYTLASGRATRYAMGWAVTTHETLTVAEHGGGIPGFACHVVRMPSERLFVAVLSNNPPSGPDTLARQLTALAIGRPFKDPPVASVPAPTLESYVGTYELEDDEPMRVAVAEGRLTIEHHGRTRVMSASGPMDFFEPAGVLRLTFQPGASGDAMTMKVWGWGEPREARRVRRE
ncbi:MAG TPA: serine hydrolase [Vicinamibacterales bacterium]|nr:serine hydrolase [Vicinamibacterales bacterium]